MGMNSVLVILNDHLHIIRDDPDFGRKVYYAVSGFPHVDRAQCFSVVSVGHASHEQIVAVSHNAGAHLDSEEYEAVMKVRRKRSKRPDR